MIVFKRGVPGQDATLTNDIARASDIVGLGRTLSEEAINHQRLMISSPGKPHAPPKTISILLFQFDYVLATCGPDGYENQIRIRWTPRGQNVRQWQQAGPGFPRVIFAPHQDVLAG